MSDVAQGPGWWQASDGKWYSPEQLPGSRTPSTVPQWTAPGPEATSEPGSPQAGTHSVDPSVSGAAGPGPPTVPGYIGSPPVGPGQLSAGEPFSGFPPPFGGPYGYPSTPRNNGLAIASFVCSFFFWLYGLGAVLAIVFGFIARSQIRRSGGTQRGGGMALAGIIIGFCGLAIGIGLIVVIIAVVHHCDQTGTCHTDLHCGPAGHCTFNSAAP